MKYPVDFGELVWRQILMTDTKQNLLYLWYTSPYQESGKIAKIHMKTKEYEIIPAIEQKVAEDKAVNVKDEIHIIGGESVNRHVVFDKNTEKFQVIHTFEFERMFGTLVVYIETKDVILAIGGSTDDDEPTVGIMEYSLKSKKWRKIDDIRYTYYGGHALLTKDEKHVILAPKYDDADDDSDDDEYEDVDGMIFWMMEDIN